MPQVGFQLPDGSAADFERCLRGEVDAGLPLPILSAMVEELRTNPHRGPLLSVTALLGCLRAVFLERTRDYVAAPIQNWYPHRGTVMHRAVETSMEGWLFESTFERAFGARSVRGRIDAYDIKTETLYDWKSVSETRLSGIMVYGLPREHILQVNAYRLLMAERHPVRAMKLVYLGMNEIAITGASPEVSARGVRYLPEVERLPDAEVEDLLTRNAETLGRAFETGDPPPVAAPETRRWKCGRFCPVREHCVAFGDHSEFSSFATIGPVPVWAGDAYASLKIGASPSAGAPSSIDPSLSPGKIVSPVLPPPPPVPASSNQSTDSPRPWWPQA
jgi:hypothetical protein